MCIHRRARTHTEAPQRLPLRSFLPREQGRVGQAVGRVPGQSPIAQCQDHTGSQRSGTWLSESLAIRLCGPRAYNILEKLGFCKVPLLQILPGAGGFPPTEVLSPTLQLLGGLVRSTEITTSDPTQGAQPIRYHTCLHVPSHMPRTFGPQGLCTGCSVFLDSPSPTFNTSSFPSQLAPSPALGRSLVGLPQ